MDAIIRSLKVSKNTVRGYCRALGRISLVDGAQIRESLVDSYDSKGKKNADDCRTQEEIVPVRVFDPVQKIAERGNDLIQPVVKPRSRPEKVMEVFEIELALVSEFGKEANRDGDKQ
jgi:hypothetical protein